ncbi:hypothetical protein B0O99DRAFT_694489 [Bisporella sp. PMI_857]|nr:hypothetical protein B0O99DRAFT_694489 [Bisporella sp. PMI_857]
MPPKGKNKVPRAFKGTTSTKPTPSTESDPPQPFMRPSPKLDQFLSKLSKNHVYITHIDTKPRDFKRKIFLVPVLMNVVLIAGIFWRIRTIGPYYMKICFSLMGKYNETTLNTANMPLNDVIHELFRRFAVFMVDLLIYIFIWPWPRDFVAGQTIGNPVSWRLAVGFRDKEIMVRRSRKWIKEVTNVLDEQDPGTLLLYSNVRQAVDPIWMSQKTGYLMLNKEWDLEWWLMVQATKLVDQKKLELQDFNTTVLVYHKEFGWMASGVVVPGNSVAEEEGRRKIVAFKEELDALGKENLFFSWIELVQFESSQPGGFTPERQAITMAKAKDMFEAQGVDFEKFWTKIGGMQGMPGMDEV